MSSTTRNHVDPSLLKAPPPSLSPPPQYTEVTSHTSSADLKAAESKYSHGPWLLKRTSIHVESAPINVMDDTASEDISISTRNEEKGAVRNLISRFGNKPSEELHDDRSSIAASTQPHKSNAFGTTVSIEACQPRKLETKPREMKGLEQAASIWRWTGTGQPAEAWGKLMKDPELWDPSGDTLVYFGYQRPQASFRVQSSLLGATQSDQLISKLQDGFLRTSRVPHTHSLDGSSVSETKHLSLDKKKNQIMRRVSEPSDSADESHIRYEIHFPPADDVAGTDILRHHITTRNFLAVLMNKPFVGLTFYQALIDLHERLQLYMPRGTDCAQLIIRSLTINHLHNVCNAPAMAAGLLAWSEDLEVRWPEGWREGFVHCCGMYARLQDIPEFRDVSHVSRSLLERAHLELGARIQVAEERLSNFGFDDIWAGTEFQLHASRTVFDQFQRFLQQHYGKAHKPWPPQKTQSADNNWLTRSLVTQLQKDFSALYDYHVDRDAIWGDIKESGNEYRSIVRRIDRENLEVNRIDVCLAKLLTRFDQKYKYAHIPHPYPLLPDITHVNGNMKYPRPRLFRSKSRELEKRIIHAYLEASNSILLEQDITTNGLLIAFLKFEKTDNLGDSDPSDARKARWILLYGILQVLSSLAVDTPDLFFKEDASYLLNPRLKGTPPWKTGNDDMFQSASQLASYCWRAPALSWGQNRQANDLVRGQQ